MNREISVLIPSYNRPDYICKAIESVIRYSGDFELLISDDCSPKEKQIREIVDTYNDRRIKYFSQGENIGEARNRQFLINESCGDYLMFLCDDDALNDKWFEILMYEISSKKNDIIFFGYNVINEDDKVLSTRNVFKRVKLDNDKVIKKLITFQDFPYYYFSPVSFCFNKKVSNEILSTNEVGIADDLAFIADSLMSGKFKSIIIPEIVLSYRKFSSQSDYDQKNLSKSILKQKESLHLLYKYIKKTKKESKYKEYVRSKKYLYQLLLCNKSINILMKSNVISESDKNYYKAVYDKYSFLDFKIFNKIKRILSYIITNYKYSETDIPYK